MLRFLNVVLLASAIGGGLGYLAFCRAPADYQSTARLVIPVPIEPVQAADDHRLPTERPTERPVQRAKRELMADATLQRALGNSELLAIRSVKGGAVSLEQVRQNLLQDESDEPPGVIIVHCRAASALAAQTILTSVIDAYFVIDGQRRDAGEAETARLIAEARTSLHHSQGQSSAEAGLQKLVESWDTSTDDPAVMASLSQQRAALLLRRNVVLRQLAQIERGQPSPSAESPAAPPSARTRKTTGPAALAPGMGAQEREAQLLEEDDKLALRYGPEHPKRKAIRLEIELLQQYPAEQAQLLAERSQLLQQFGPSHPRLQAIQQRLDELGITPPVAVSIPTGLASPLDLKDIAPGSRLETLQAALAELDAQDGVLKRQIESVQRARELNTALRQILSTLPTEGSLPAIDAALDRLEHLSSVQTALRPYLALRPTLGVPNGGGMLDKILRGAAVGAMVGGVLAFGILWAGRRA
ncbi:MAG TPA: hypothetical protein VIK18_25000 [Pirellulales bacterium]